MLKQAAVHFKKLIRYGLPHRALIFAMRAKYVSMFSESQLLILNSVSGGTVIDCGANIGVASSLFIKKGAAKVLAFEPDPIAFDRLKLTVNFLNPKLAIFQAAVGTSSGVAKLFFTAKRTLDPLASTYGSSISEFNSGITGDYVEVMLVDLADIIFKNAPIRLLKIDIEGHEVEVVPYLLASKVLDQVERVVVETHERKSPALMDKTKSMIELVNQSEYSEKFTFDWP